MLFRYFLQRLFIRFVLFFLGLVPLFASCDLLVRLASVPFSFQILKLLWFMMPLVAVFAVPIAALLSVGITVGNIFANDELLMFYYFSSVRKILIYAISIFTISLFAIYVPILFNIAPHGYWEGKRFLIKSAQMQIENLSPQKFHTLVSRCTIFFKAKECDNSQTVFSDILMMVREKGDKQYLITAQSGNLQSGTLSLLHGTIYNNSSENGCVATFKKLDIEFEKIFFDSEKNFDKPTKFMTLQELQDSINGGEEKRWQELHKRIVQAIWLLLFPFLMFWMMMSFGKAKSNVLLSIVISGGLFLFSYISLNMAYFTLGFTIYSGLVFYCIPFVLAGIIYLRYKRVWG